MEQRWLYLACCSIFGAAMMGMIGLITGKPAGAIIFAFIGAVFAFSYAYWLTRNKK